VGFVGLFGEIEQKGGHEAAVLWAEYAEPVIISWYPQTGRAKLLSSPVAGVNPAPRSGRPPVRIIAFPIPEHESTEKRVRQNEKRRIRNRYQKVRMRTLVKQLETTEDKAEAETLLNEVKAQLDRLATKRIITPNKAAHLKSRLEKQVNAL